MIVGENFVYLHLHKTGGTFVQECLLKSVQGTQQIGYHLPRHQIPAAHAHKPVLGLVRNPWAYYVSWYAFQAARPRPNPLFQTLSDDGALGFEETIRNMLLLSKGGKYFDAIRRQLPATYVNKGINLPTRDFANILGSGLGFYSFLYNHMYAGTTPPHIGKMETLRTELPLLLERVGQARSDTFKQFINTEEKRNTSEHRPYQDYYSPSLCDMVARADRGLIETHNYGFST